VGEKGTPSNHGTHLLVDIDRDLVKTGIPLGDSNKIKGMEKFKTA